MRRVGVGVDEGGEKEGEGRDWMDGRRRKGQRRDGGRDGRRLDGVGREVMSL